MILFSISDFKLSHLTELLYSYSYSPFQLVFMDVIDVRSYYLQITIHYHVIVIMGVYVYLLGNFICT